MKKRMLGTIEVGAIGIDGTLDSLTIYGDCKEDKVFALGDMLKKEGYVIGESWKNK